jgi:hypothetical protein
MFSSLLKSIWIFAICDDHSSPDLHWEYDSPLYL